MKNKYIQTSNDDIFYIVNEYHIEVSCPQFERSMPTREEIREVMGFADDLLENVLKKLNIDKADIL